MSERVRVRCSRCAGTGQCVQRTGQLDVRCYCCGGVGHYYRRKAGTVKRESDAEYYARQNAMIAATWPQSQEKTGD